MYTVRTILINTENKTNKKQTKQEEEEQKQHQNTLPHLKRERIKRVREGGASGEMGCWWESYSVNTVYSCPYPYPYSYSVRHTEP